MRPAATFPSITLSLKRNAPWKVAFPFGKSVDRWTLQCISFCLCYSNSHDHIRPCRGHLTSTLGHRGSQWIHGAFLLRLSVKQFKLWWILPLCLNAQYVTGFYLHRKQFLKLLPNSPSLPGIQSQLLVIVFLSDNLISLSILNQVIKNEYFLRDAYFNPKMDMQKIVTLDGFGVGADPRDHFGKNATLT